MGFSEKDYEKIKEVNPSIHTIYKQAGNSIVVDVLFYIYLSMYQAMPSLFDDVKISSYFSGIGAFEKAFEKLEDYIEKNS